MLAVGRDVAQSQWIVDLRGDPQSVHEHRKLARYGHDGAFLVVLAASAG